MIPTSKDHERHPVLCGVIAVASGVLLVTGIIHILGLFWGPMILDLGIEIDWEKVLPVIIKFAAETLVAAYSVFRLLKPIEARLAVVEAKLDLMGSGKELYRILSEEE